MSVIDELKREMERIKSPRAARVEVGPALLRRLRGQDTEPRRVPQLSDLPVVINLDLDDMGWQILDRDGVVLDEGEEG
jgi:hypothetical protein